METFSHDVWTTFSERLLRFIRKRVANEHDAEDVLQDVFVKIHQRIDQLQDAEKLPAWVFQIARRAVIDYYRARSSTPEQAELPDELAERREPEPTSADVADCLAPMIERLPEPYRQAVVMTELEGRTQRELADTLGLSVSGAKSRVQRGRERLKTMLLDCCHFAFDRRGRVIDYEPRIATCRACGKNPPAP